MPLFAVQIAGSTADGTGDRSNGGSGIVIAGTAYAFIAPDGKVGGDGRKRAWFDSQPT